MRMINISAATIVLFLAIVIIRCMIPGHTRKDRIDALFDPGPLHGQLIEEVTQDLKIPESFGHSKTEYKDLGGNQVKVDMYFTADNEQGIAHLYCAHAMLDTTGRITFYKIEP